MGSYGLRVDLAVGCRGVLVLHHVGEVGRRAVRGHVQVLKVARVGAHREAQLDWGLGLGRVHRDAVHVQRIVVLHQDHVLAEQVLVAGLHFQDACGRWRENLAEKNKIIPKRAAMTFAG